MQLYSRTTARVLLGAFALLTTSGVMADLDGHGPDAWRVIGVEPGQQLQARMGPGINYRATVSFPRDARSLQQITCVPFVRDVDWERVREAEHGALVPRWCLIHDLDKVNAGWVEAQYLAPDYGDGGQESGSASNTDALITEAEGLVRTLYEVHTLWLDGAHAGIYEPDTARLFFTADVAERLLSGQLQEDPLFGAQDFDGSMDEPVRDPVQPMLRGMITVHVNFTNFGERRRATLRLRADTDLEGAPVRIFSIEHGERAFPSHDE